MNTSITAKNRILSFALAVSLLLGMTLVMPGAVEVRAALPDKDDEGERWDGVDFAALEGSGIYYGTYDHATSLDYLYHNHSYEGTATPVLWRVMGEEAGSGNLTLMSEYVLDGKAFHGGSNVYSTSGIRDFLNGDFMNSFTATEKLDDHMPPITVVTGKHEFGTETRNNTQQNGVDYPDSVSGEKVYLMWGTSVSDGGWKENVFWTAGDDIQDNYALFRNASGNDQDNNIGYLKSDTMQTNPVSYWLRSPYSGTSDRAMYVRADGGVDLAYVGNSRGVRPAFQLNPSSVIFTSEIGLDEDKGGTDAVTNIYSSTAAAGGVAKNYKLTIVNSDITLDDLEKTIDNTPLTGGGEELQITSGNTLDLTGTFTGADNLVYKIVERSSGEIVGYGAGSGSNITVKGIANVTSGSNLSLGNGNYTLYVWAQDNNDEHSHEGSEPWHFALNVVDEADATLKSVAGEDISTTSGTGTNDSDPFIASITLGSSWSSVSDNDLVTTNENATAALYEDDTYNNAANSVTLEDPTTELYIKVTAEDDTTVLYYEITVTLDAVPVTPSVFPTSLTVPEGNDDTFIVYLGSGADEATSADIVSNDTTYATVDTASVTNDGEVVTVTGEAAGDTTITVTWNGGSMNGQTETVYVTVTGSGGHTDGPDVDPHTLTITTGDTATFAISLGESGNRAVRAEVTSNDPDIATVDPDDLTVDGDITVTGESAGSTTVTVTFSDGDLTGPIEKTISVTVRDSGDPDIPGPTTRSSSRSSSGNGGSNVRPEPKTTLPATAFAWDGARTLTIDHERITPFGLLTVQWDGAVLERGTEYGVYEGSVIVRFDAEFIAAQSPGEHTVRVEFLNHTGEATVTVGETGLTDEAALMVEIMRKHAYKPR